LLRSLVVDKKRTSSKERRRSEEKHFFLQERYPGNDVGMICGSPFFSFWHTKETAFYGAKSKRRHRNL
jgi:hypothetical protein